MITQVETAVAAFLRARFAGADPAVTAPVVEATTNKPPPEDRSVVVVLCGKPDHQGGGMYDVPVNCIVRTPEGVKGVTVTSHAAVESALAAAFGVQSPEILTALTAAITAQLPQNNCCGYHVEGWQPGREDTSWVPSFQVKLGIDPV